MQISIEERRKHRRHRIENSVSISSHGVFQIVDISLGGFRFKCPPHTTIPAYWDTDIITSTASLLGLTAKLAWMSMPESGRHDYVPTVVGARFGILTDEQRAILSKIIKGISQQR